MKTCLNPRRFEGRTAIITGGARGFGLAIARRLCDEGCRVILWDVNFENSDTGSVDPLLMQTVDITDAGAVQAAFREAVAAAGTIDILVNNAGINGQIAPSWEYPEEAWHNVIDINLNGAFYCCRAAIPHMRERGFGRIINMASIAGKEGNPGGSAYAASKGGLIAFTKSIAKELAQSGILINAVAPTMAATDLLNEMTPEFISSIKSKIPMGRLVTIEEIAATVAYVASDDCSFTTGFTFDLTGGRATY